MAHVLRRHRVAVGVKGDAAAGVHPDKHHAQWFRHDLRETEQPWLFVGGELTSAEGQAASGGTFAGADVAFDPETIFDPLLAEVPGIRIESFYVHGDGEGNLLYGVLATSERGGGLDIVLAADGSVLSVDPVSEAP